jgi:hypothetical protein
MDIDPGAHAEDEEDVPSPEPNVEYAMTTRPKNHEEVIHRERKRT